MKNEIIDVVRSVNWLLRYTQENYADLSPKEQIELDIAWDQIRVFYETKFTYTRVNKYKSGTSGSQGTSFVQKNKGVPTTLMEKISSSGSP